MIFKQECCDYLKQHNIHYDENDWFTVYCHHKDKMDEKIKKEKLEIMLKEAEKSSKECDERLFKLEKIRRKRTYQRRLKKKMDLISRKVLKNQSLKEIVNPDQKKKEKKLKKLKKEKELKKWREQCEKAQEERKRQEKESNGIIQLDFIRDDDDIDSLEIENNEEIIAARLQEKEQEKESIQHTTKLIQDAIVRKEQKDKQEAIEKRERELKAQKEKEEKEKEEKSWSSVVKHKKKKKVQPPNPDHDKVKKQRQQKLDLIKFAAHAKMEKEKALKRECERKGMAYVENMKTRICKSIMTNTPCRHGHRCRFAHRPSELRFSECRWGMRCRHGDRCFNKHKNESIEAYYLRLGFPRHSLGH